MDGAAIFLLLLSFHIFHQVYTIELDIISDSQFLTDGDTLVSRTGIFELGFFRPGGSEKRYLGIWYKKIDVKTVVWVANRDYPLPNTSLIVLRIVDPGILVLSSNISMIWSSNTTMTSRNATAKLYDTGNLVLMDQQEKVLWQSFDYPTDTLLPGMKLGRDFLRGIEWHLSSWKSSQDPGSGGFTWGATTHGYPENKLKKGEEVKFRGGPWSNQRVRGYGYSIYNSTKTSTYKVVMTEKEVSFAYNVENSSILSKITLSSSGELEISEWLDDDKNWHLSLTLPVDFCDIYNICSAYGSCSVNMVQHSCACLDDKRFVPRNQTGWETADWSGGCVRRTPLECKNGSAGFIKYSNVKLPDRESTLFYINMTSEQCLTTCLENCNCMAYANIDTRFEENGCLHWLNDLLDIRVFPQGSIGLDLFLINQIIREEQTLKSSYL